MLEDLTLHKALKLAVETEKVGAEYYARLGKRFAGEKEVADIFNQLSRDELVHEAQFKKLLEKVPADAPTESYAEKYNFLRATAISEFFRSGTFDDADKIATSGDALLKALNFEKSTLMYYQAIEAVMGENDQLTELIKAERGHMMTIMQVLMTGEKFKGTLDKWKGDNP